MTVSSNFYYFFVIFILELHSSKALGFYNKPRIWKGDPVAIEDAPYTVEIYMDNGHWKGTCGTGVLIEVEGVQAILTSARNLMEYLYNDTTKGLNHPETGPNSLTIYAGSNVSQQGATVKLTKATNYPGRVGWYDEDKSGVLHMEHNLPVTEKIQPVQLPAKDLVHVSDLFITGWGYIFKDGADVEFVGLTGYHGAPCDTDATDLICVLNPPGQGPSQDDSGAPAVAIINGVRTVVGIVSMNFGRQPREKSYFPKVSFYLDWIVNTVLQEKEGNGQYGMEYWY